MEQLYYVDSLNQIKFWKHNLTEVNDKQFASDLSC